MEQSTGLTVQRQVRNGMEFLDSHGPEGWDGEVDLNLLDMFDCVVCVLGQLYGSYEAGKDRHFLSGGDTVRLGFAAIRDTGDSDYCPAPDAYDELTRAWRQALMERRRASQVTG